MAPIPAISYAKLVISRLISNPARFSLYSNPLKFHICAVIRPTSLQNPISPVYPLRIHPTTKPNFRMCTIAESVAVEENTETTPQENQRRKLYIQNLPWSMTAVDIKNLFSECGTVVDVEIIKQRNGRGGPFMFVTMAAREEGQAAIEKFNASDVSGRIIKVEFAKSLKKPPKTPLPEDPTRGETRHKLFLSNLAWKVRSTHLKEFASAFNPVSARVVFISPGKSAGYGFVSFSTKEEAEAAMASLDGKELLNRAVRLSLSESKHEVEEATEKVESENKAEELTKEAISENKAEEVTEKVLSENEVEETREEKHGGS